MIKVSIKESLKYVTIFEYESICDMYESWCNDHCDPSEWRWVYPKNYYNSENLVNVNNKTGIRFEKATDATAFKLRFIL